MLLTAAIDTLLSLLVYTGSGQVPLYLSHTHSVGSTFMVCHYGCFLNGWKMFGGA
jgi:hypothetical protein